jgi:CheY-like chemotaxis protein
MIASPSDKPKVAIIDDESEMGYLYAEMLKIGGFSATVYTESISLLELLESDANQYDVIISDVRMPGINGYELSERIIALNNSVKVLLLTAYSDIKDQKCYNSNIPVLLKPFQSNTLVEFVNKNIEAHPKLM